MRRLLKSAADAATSWLIAVDAYRDGDGPSAPRQRSLDDYADQVHAVVNYLGEPVHLIGFCWGGATGLHVAVTTPEVLPGSFARWPADRREAFLDDQRARGDLWDILFDAPLTAEALTRVPVPVHVVEGSPTSAVDHAICDAVRRHVPQVEHFEDSRTGEDQQAFRAALARIVAELAGEWPSYRDLDGTLAGAAQRRDNVSEVWAWLGGYEVARGYVSDVFEDAQLSAMPVLVEHTGDALNGLLGTMSFWARLSPRQRDALVAENHALHQRLGRSIRSSTAACVVTAPRARRT